MEKQTIKLKVLDTQEVKDFPIYQAANLLFNQNKRWGRILYEQEEQFDFASLPPPETGECYGCGGQKKK